MPTSCCAYNCTERFVPGRTVSFHRFPTKNEMLFRTWCIALRRKDFHPTWSSRICSKHFTKDSFTIGSKCRMLKRDAVPTIFNFGKKPPKKYTRKNHIQNSPIGIMQLPDGGKIKFYQGQSQTFDSSIYGPTEESTTFDKLDGLPSKQLKNMQYENEVLRQTIFQLNKKIEEFKNLTNIIPSDDLLKDLCDDESSGSSKICTPEERRKSVEIIKIKRGDSSQCNEYEYHHEQVEESADGTTEGSKDLNKHVKTESIPLNQLKNLQNENEVLRRTMQNLKKIIKRIKCLARALRLHDLV